MNIGFFLLGIVGIVGGTIILLNLERAFRLSQKYLRRNVGQLGELIAEEGKPSHLIVPGIGTILIGVSLVFRAFT